jgi:hypothetical protein
VGLGKVLEPHSISFFNACFSKHTSYTSLDGGHVVFLLYEIVVGRPAPEKFMESAQVVGMLILLALVVYANGNDIMKLF